MKEQPSVDVSENKVRNVNVKVPKELKEMQNQIMCMDNVRHLDYISDCCSARHTELRALANLAPKKKGEKDYSPLGIVTESDDAESDID